MSHRFKRPKQYANMGNPDARLRKYAERISCQDELDSIVNQAKLSKVEPDVIENWIKLAAPHLKFTPRQLASVPAKGLQTQTDIA